MEPVFMVLGQSAATAACQAIDAKTTVQDVDVKTLRGRLAADGQVLRWTGPRPVPPILSATLKGIVVDDRQAKLTGDWSLSRSVGGFVDRGYLHDGNQNKGKSTAEFRPKIARAGRYEIRIAYTPHPNRATNVPVTVTSADRTRTVTLNQKTGPKQHGFQSIGTFRFEKGTGGNVTISNAETNGYVIVDAVQFLPVE